MSFTLNGVTYTPKTATQHAQNMLAEMNNSLISNGLPSLSATQSNALWWTLLAQGSVNAEQDLALIQAANSMNIALCDDDQILALLPTMGTSLIPASPSSLTLTITADASGVTIPIGSTVSVSGYRFSTIQALVLGSNATGSVGATCSVNGPVTIAPGSVTAFSPTIAHVASVTNASAAIPGRDLETVTACRTRLLNGGANMTGLTGANTAIRSLPGITQASVLFNTFASTPIPLNGVLSLANGSSVVSGYTYIIGNTAGGLSGGSVGTTVWTTFGASSNTVGLAFVATSSGAISGTGTCAKAIPSRTAQIVVSGSSPSIASTFLDYMPVPTQGASSQTWSAPSGQVLTVYYDTATTQNVYVTVNVLSAAPRQTGYDNLIRNTIVTLNPSLKIGQTITTQTIANLFSSYSAATIVSYQLSLDGVTWSNSINANWNALPAFVASSTYIVVALV
jgi:hypothetical protein